MTDDLWIPGWDDEPASPPPQPLPLDLSIISRPGPFPTHVLPPVFRHMVVAVAANKQVPEDFVATFGLGAISTLTGPRIAITRGHGWTEPLNLYIVDIMDSGTGKTPAAADVIRPLRRIQKQMKVDHNDAIDSKVDELAARRGEATRDPATANRIEDEIKELEQARRRPPRLMLGSDSTVESVAEYMSRNNGHAAILDAEGEFFGILSGRYSKSIPNLGLALKAYDGDLYEVGRIGRMQDDIHRAILTLAFGVQPTVMIEVARDKAMVERGFLARCLFAFPPSLLGTRAADGTEYDFEAMANWATALERLNELPMPPQDEEDFPALRLDRSARKRHVEFCEWIERRLHPDDGDLGNLPGWASKHKGRALRIAGLLHLVHGYSTDESVGERAMNAAVEICQWAIGHAIAVFGMGAASIGDDDTQCAEVVAWIRRTNRAEFQNRDAVRGVRRNWVNAITMAAALDRLTETGHVAVKQVKNRGGRVVTVFVSHPSLLSEVDRAAA